MTPLLEKASGISSPSPPVEMDKGNGYLCPKASALGPFELPKAILSAYEPRLCWGLKTGWLLVCCLRKASISRRGRRRLKAFKLKTNELGKTPLSSNIAETLIIGNGRMATQFKQCLQTLGIPFSSWLRSEGAFSLSGRTQAAKRILLLIPDKAISPLIDEYEHFFKNKILIHFSATHRDSRALGFHPLGTFTCDQKVDFQCVYFHGIHPESLFNEALPFLKNSYKQLSEEHMQVYHALCVVGGNFSAILWNAFFKEMLALGVSEDAARSYIEMLAQNILQNPSSSVSGPLVRNDNSTIEKNILALEGKKELQQIYKAFVKNFAGSEYLS